MVVNHLSHLLFIEPQDAPKGNGDPEIIKKVKTIWENCVESNRFRGSHSTGLGVDSDNANYRVKGLEVVTNSLCVFYAENYKVDPKPINIIYERVTRNKEFLKAFFPKDGTYYLKQYGCNVKYYGNTYTIIAKAEGKAEDLRKLFSGVIIEAASKKEFEGCPSDIHEQTINGVYGKFKQIE